MSKISIIIAQEYRNRVAKVSFLLLTFLMPVLFVAIILVPVWLSSIDSGGEKEIVVVDQTSLYYDLFESMNRDDMKFVVLKEQNSDEIEDLRTIKLNNYRAFVLITEDLGINPRAINIYCEKQVPRDVSRYVESSLSKYIEREKLESYNIEGLQKMIADAKTDVKATVLKMKDDGSVKNSNADIAIFVGMFTTMLIYMFIFVSGSMVMSSIVQEKANRIVEVMVCSVKPWEMMWGKIISIALVCLTQIALWGVLTSALVFIVSAIANIDIAAISQTASMAQTPAELSSMSDVEGIIAAVMSINWVFIGVMFLVYFICGYLLYASMFAAIGASVDNESDTNQFMMPITIVVLFAFYAGIYSAQNPDGPLAFWCSIVPFSSPIVMMVRLPFDVPGWQIILSLSLLVLTIIGITWLSAKIYRVGILMYGKKPSWKELAKWLKY
ncbi:MAG: ABC transporter permease [bacterium]